MPAYDEYRIAQLEERLVTEGLPRTVADLDLLADLYLQADSYQPARQTIERLLARPEARELSADRRAGLESKAIACRLRQGDAQGALAHCRQLLQDENALDRVPLRARIHIQCGEALFFLGRFDEAAAEAEAALKLGDSASDLGIAAAALNLMGTVEYRRGDLETARDLFEQSLALYRRVGDDVATTAVRNNLGLIHKNRCEWDSAAAHIKLALELMRKHGRFAETISPLMNLGVVHQKTGDWTQATESYAQAQQVAAQVGQELSLANAAIGLGNVARLERRFDDAERSLQDALDRARKLNAPRQEALALEFLGELEHDRGHDDEALQHYQAALQIAERIAPEGDLVVEVERRRAEALLALGRLDAAEDACQRASRLARLTDDRLEYAVSERVAGSIARARGRIDEAFASWRVAETQLAACNERYELGRTYLEMARGSAEPAEARRWSYRAGALFATLSSPYWLELSEREQPVPTGHITAAPVRPASSLGRRHRAPGLVACSNAMRQVETLARRAARTELSVLITGETGTGKELVARTIHSLSPRAQQPFLAVNCGALRADLALSQLFGHRKGAFTGAHADGVGLVEAAHGGTLFLDEVGELPHDVQVTLLRFLETGEYMRLGESQVRRADVRIIAATNRELRGSDEKMFRRDLLFRMNEIEIRVPSLRDRRPDIVPLARHFLGFYGGLAGPKLSVDAESVLASAPWPGNVRELENVMKRVAALHGGEPLVTADGLMPFLAYAAPPRARYTNGNGHNGHSPVDERAEILSAYAEARGNKSRVASMLGVSRKTLYARLKRLSLELP